MPREALLAIEDSIRQGRGSEAQRRIQTLARKKTERGDVVVLAELARRAGIPVLGLRLLNPFVRSDRKRMVRCTAEESLQYAACLTRVGAVMEATTILKALDGEAHPSVFLYLGFAFLSEWNYEEAIPLFLKYIRHPRVNAYSRMVGKINLAESYVSEGDYLKAEPLLRDLLFESSAQKLHLVLGKALELSAQNFIMQGKLGRAREFLKKSIEFLRSSGGRDEFNVRKWWAIWEFQMERGSESSLKSLRTIRREALQREHWESVRACDRSEAVVRKDQELFLHVYFGTPYESFRRQFLHDFKTAVSLPDSFLWNLKGKAHANAVIDLTQYAPGALKPGQLLHRLLTLLSSDFYRPFTLAEIHSALHPKEYFNPTTAAHRVHQAIKRLRGWAKDSHVPLRIDEHRGSYRLNTADPCAIRVNRISTPNPSSVFLVTLKKAWGARVFSTAQAAEELRLSYSSAQRCLTDAVKRGELVKAGGGSSTRYHFPLMDAVSKN